MYAMHLTLVLLLLENTIVVSCPHSYHSGDHIAEVPSTMDNLMDLL